MPRTKEKPLTVTIANQSVSLFCHSPKIQKILQKRYQGFLSTGSPCLKAEIKLTGERRKHASEERELSFRGKIADFQTPGYEGWINPIQGEARLKLSSMMPIEDIDYFLRVIYTLLAFESGGFLFHAAGIVKENRAYLFFGPSGSGKTTVARLSTPNLVLNDDLLFLSRNQHDCWQAHSTPFWNRSQVQPTNQNAPLFALYRLVQAKRVNRQIMSQGQALAELISSIPILPLSKSHLPALLKTLDTIIQSTPIYYLYFLQDHSFWSVVSN